MKNRIPSPGVRNLAHQKPKIYEQVILKGKMHKQVSPEKNSNKPNLYKWEDFLLKKNIGSRPSTADVTPTMRTNEFMRAKRTIEPQLNEEKSRIQSKRMVSPEKSPEKPGNWASLLNKTATTKDLHKAGKRTYRDHQSTNNIKPATPIHMNDERRILKSNPYKQNDWNSHISGLPCSTHKEEPVRSPSRNASTTRRHYGEAVKRGTHYIDSSFRAGSPKKPKDFFNDQTVDNSFQSSKKQLAKFLNTSITHYQPQDLNRSKRDVNKESYVSYFDEGRINPCTPGKKPINRGASNERSKTPTVDALNPCTKGKKLLQQKNIETNIYAASREASPAPGKGRSIYSYRSYASQVPL